MARPRKTGLDYFPHDVDVTTDPKIEPAIMRYGAAAYAFYFVHLEYCYRSDDLTVDISAAETGAETTQSIAKKSIENKSTEKKSITTTSIPPTGGSAAPVVNIQEKRFEEFWAAYPKKTGKQAAFKSWQRIKPTAELHTKIMEAVATAKRTEQWQRENGRFIPNPATWLNQGRWDDEYAENRVPENTRKTKLEGFHMADEEEAPRPSAEEPKLTGFKRAWYEEDDADDEAVRL